MSAPISHLQNLFVHQKASFSFERVPSVAERQAQLRKLAGAIREHEQALVDAVDQDFGCRSALETRSAEIAVSVAAANHSIKHLKRWAAPKRHANVGNNIPGKTYTRAEAKGVVGIISPWNYPIQLSLVPLITALSAGNHVMLKPSELTPATNEVLSQLVGSVFTETQVAVVTGDAQVGEAFSALPFDHLFYTGSTRVGRLVAMAAASNLTPVTLELGGKSPCLMMADANPEEDSKLVAFGKLYNAGQTCVAPDYLLVPKGQASAYGSAILHHAQSFYADPAAPESYTTVISEGHHSRLTDLVAEAEKQGAEIRSVEISGASHPRYLAPTVVINPAPDSTIMHEEIFGPVLPILEYDTLDEAITFITNRDHPLALYVFGQDVGAAERVLERTTSGGAVINGTIVHVAVEHLPFGGVGKSGYGAYHGERGFREFSHERSVLVFPRWKALAGILTPPYGKVLNFITRRTIDKKA
ncbi:MAG: coniferyl aldehyde dehydrogenase [Pseudomonadota bacterium]